MDVVEMWKRQIAKEREDIQKYGFGGDGGINYPDDGTDYPVKLLPQGDEQDGNGRI